MEQLVFDLAPEPPAFDNFLPGANAEALAVAIRFADGRADETSLLLCGATGVGKSHLLQAAVRQVDERGGRASSFTGCDGLERADIDSLVAQDLIAVDDIESASPESQARLFTLYNGLRSRGGCLIAAARLPLAALPLREDVRTRLGWGLVYSLTSLKDDEKPAALLAYARRRGLRLSDDVIRYLLVHGRRDMTTLLATLAALDRYSLATRRAITVPLLRDWLQGEIPLRS